MPTSSDQSSKKAGKQRTPVTDSLPIRSGQSKAHKSSIAPFEERSFYQSTDSHALIPARSAAFRADTHSVPPSYNDDTSTEYDQDDQDSTAEETLPRSCNEDCPGHPGTGDGYHSHHNHYKASSHNDGMTNNVTYSTTNFVVQGHQLNGDASSGKLLTDFLEKFMAEHFKKAPAETQA
ncbi:hypothetical protein LTR10_015069 [Elasticomyces elasticus]|uniref:Uncharacterized protein n=1 Tax=Exophiala sideris TaxID=1016849 RepID=A0ABR0JSA1_9EURO|nr:hypothetical protein LTR10_015069 [Elasticomyces elasticus]KAK5034734.1 hypothetical protein LTR13_006391 [Exophiala sideris]KAK5039945.1 hypothetical protein LTS07_000440 [Exophiala sideris]KAK5068324.1 hypothetical protein LTR69_000442 [Exophiala sideris]KAK5187625.1 hypothetical protein LTR44_000441 [Eurotiomycetes sp. CCFEE 6388]